MSKVVIYNPDRRPSLLLLTGTPGDNIRRVLDEWGKLNPAQQTAERRVWLDVARAAARADGCSFSLDLDQQTILAWADK